VILKTLTLENFRQFYGRHTITFADHEERNVTMVYGANGSGKTTLLNAFTWGLYNETTPAFDAPDDLVNHRAWAEADPGSEVKARVVLVFEHSSSLYTVDRYTTERKGPEGERLTIQDAHVEVTVVDEGGRSYDRTDTAVGTIGQILPERLHNFFFFDGERIEQLVKPDSYAEIADAIKTILGLVATERAIGHLDDARKTLEREFSKIGGDEVKAIADRVDAARGEREALEETIASATENRSACRSQLETVNSRLAQLSEAAELQRQREGLEADLASISAEIDNRNASLASLLSDRGHLAFVRGLAKEATDTFATLRTKGEIPTLLKLQLVDDLLDNGECICGAHLKEGDPAYMKVASWRQRAGREDVETAWISLSATAKHLEESRGQFYHYLHETRGELRGYRDQLNKTKEQLSQIKDEMSGLDSDEVKQLESRRDALKEDIENEGLTIKVADRDLGKLNADIADLERELEEAGEAEAEAALAKRRVVVAREARDFCIAALKIRTDSVRTSIDRRVREVYNRISFKRYTPELDDEFRLRLRTNVGGDEILVAKSTGENQILSLAFVGATAEHAQERHQLQKASGDTGPAEGGIYPMVMDSPFGSLDDNYQRDVAKAVPLLAPQVVLFVSKSQGLNAVRDVLLPHIEREYVIEFHTPKTNLQRETITLRSGTVPYIEPVDGDFEWAELHEVIA